MFKKLCLAAGLVASIAFAGCSTTQQAQVSKVAVDINVQVNKACAVFGPVALDAQVLYKLDPKVDLAISAMNGLCAANAAIDPSSVQTLAKTTLPAAISALGGVTGVNPDTVKAVGGALTLANAALNLWVLNYATPTAPAPASASVAASAPVAASQ